MKIALTLYIPYSYINKLKKNYTVKKYCWFNLKNEVTWLP